MPTKTIQQEQESLDQIVSDLFPKEATKFSRALNDHVANLVNDFITRAPDTYFRARHTD